MAFWIPLIAGGALGGLGGFGLGMLGKKEHKSYTYQTTYAPVSTITKTYAPSIQYAPQMSYSYQGGDIIISSPYATTKKEMQTEMESVPRLAPVYTITPQITSSPAQGITQGTNLMHLAIIGVIGLVAYGFITRKKK